MESFITTEIVREILENPPRSLTAIKAELLFLDGTYIFHSKGGYKYLSTATLRNAFSNIPIDSGWLEPGVMRCGSKPSGDWAVKFIAPQTHKLDCNELGTVTVPLPAMVFAGSLTTYWVWALKGQEFASDAQLFHAPLPNVHTRNGEICWGSNQPPSCNPQSINAAWELFISSPFNSHLANDKSKRCPEDIRQQLGKLAVKKAKKYPVSDLKPLPQNWTADSLVEAIAQND